MGKEPIVKFWEVVNILTDGSVMFSFLGLVCGLGLGLWFLGSACLRVCVLRAACLFVSLSFIETIESLLHYKI